MTTMDCSDVFSMSVGLLEQNFPRLQDHPEIQLVLLMAEALNWFEKVQPFLFVNSLLYCWHNTQLIALVQNLQW